MRSIVNGSWGLMAAAACAVISGCFATGPRTAAPTCTGDADDGIACTTDVCDVSGAYQHIPNDARCAAGEMCDVNDGCVDRDPGCPASCSDGIACTVDTCVDGACVNRRSDSLCPAGDTCRASAADGASGCYTPPTMEECDSNADCNDGVSCTLNRCVSGECRYVPDDAACGAGEVCTATGCVGDDPPPADRFCADGELIGERIRFSLDRMSGIRSFAGRAITEANAGAILWNFYGTPNTFAPGETIELPVVGGTINIHFVDGGTIAFDSRFADLQSISTATNDVTGEDMGITAEVYRSGRWVPLPEGFLYFGWDTNASARWGESPDPLIPTGARIGRLLQNTDCETQYRVYEGATYRAAR